MKKFTRQQRHQVYMEALDRIVTNKNSFICDALYSTTKDLFYAGRNPRKFPYSETVDAFPEFAKQKPNDLEKYDAWWPHKDVATRIKVLEKCIRQTRPRPIIDPIVEFVKSILS